jgi:putative ATP-dependent endonuclease of OLD family
VISRPAAEQLTYAKGDGTALYVYWRARRLPQPGSRRLADVSVRCGPEGAGQGLDIPARELRQAAYLRPLRDAEQEMSAGQGSRLSQVLSTFPGLRTGMPFDPEKMPEDTSEAQGLSLSGMAEYFQCLVNQHDGVRGAQQVINDEYLSELGLAGEGLHGHLNYTQAVTESARLRQILERLPNCARAPVKMMPASTQAPAGERSSATFHIQVATSPKRGASSGGAFMMPVTT